MKVHWSIKSSLLSHIVNYEFTGLVCTTSNKHVNKTYNVTILMKDRDSVGEIGTLAEMNSKWKTCE